MRRFLLRLSVSPSSATIAHGNAHGTLCGVVESVPWVIYSPTEAYDVPAPTLHETTAYTL